MYNNLVVVKPNVKRITLQRGILSLIFHGKEVTIDHIHVLFQNQLWLEQKSSKDKGFAEVFGRDLETLSSVLKRTNFSRGLTEGAISSLKIKLRSELAEFVYPVRNLAGIELKVNQSFYTKAYKEAGILTKQLPPKQFIGIGYRDKGTAKEPAQDGSPRWQEIAIHVSHTERRINELLEELEGLTDEPIAKLRKVREIGIEVRRLKRTRDPKTNSGDAKTSERKKSKT